MSDKNRRQVLQTLAASTTALAGAGAVNASSKTQAGYSGDPPQITVDEIKGKSKSDLQKLVLASDVFKHVTEKVREEERIEILVEEAEIKSVVQERPDSSSDEFQIVSFPLKVQGNGKSKRRSTGGRRSRGSASLMKGDLTVRVHNGNPLEALAAIRSLNTDGLTKEIQTFQSTNQKTGVASDGESNAVRSGGHEVFNNENELILDEETLLTPATAGSEVQIQGSSVCEFCKGVGNVICTLGCGVVTGVILASTPIAAPASVAAAAVVSAFCGLVVLYNDTVGKAGCGADWTVEQICAELYNNCEDDDPVY